MTFERTVQEYFKRFVYLKLYRLHRYMIGYYRFFLCVSRQVEIAEQWFFATIGWMQIFAKVYAFTCFFFLSLR